MAVADAGLSTHPGGQPLRAEGLACTGRAAALLCERDGWRELQAVLCSERDVYATTPAIDVVWKDSKP